MGGDCFRNFGIRDFLAERDRPADDIVENSPWATRMNPLDIPSFAQRRCAIVLATSYDLLPKHRGNSNYFLPSRRRCRI